MKDSLSSMVSIYSIGGKRLSSTKSEKVKFKSFNTNYLNWIYSQDGADELYEEFIEVVGSSIMEYLIKRYKLKGDKDSNDEIHQLDFYVKNIIQIYKSPIKLKDSKVENSLSELDEDKNERKRGFKELSDLNLLDEVNKQMVDYPELSCTNVISEMSNSEFIFTIK